MKSYARFKKDLTEAVPLAAPLLAPLVPKILGGAAAAVGLGGMIHQATKQGQGGRSQPADYGQGGTATPRTPNVQRPAGKVSRQNFRERERQRRREERAKERKRETQSSGIQHGPSFEKAAQEAARRREQNMKTPDQRLDDLIDKAAKNIGVKLPK